MKSVLVVAAVVVLGACATESAGRSDAGRSSAASANAPAARPAPVKCVRDMDCEGVEVCYEGFCRR